MNELEEIALAERFNREAARTGRSAYAIEEDYWERHDVELPASPYAVDEDGDF